MFDAGQGAYRKCGYVDTGMRVEMIDGVNHEKVRAFANEATA